MKISIATEVSKFKIWSNLQLIARTATVLIKVKFGRTEYTVGLLSYAELGPDRRRGWTPQWSTQNCKIQHVVKFAVFRCFFSPRESCSKSSSRWTWALNNALWLYFRICQLALIGEGGTDNYRSPKVQNLVELAVFGTFSTHKGGRMHASSWNFARKKNDRLTVAYKIWPRSVNVVGVKATKVKNLIKLPFLAGKGKICTNDREIWHERTSHIHSCVENFNPNS